MENMETKKESIKDDIIIVIKESMKFALVGVTLLLLIGTSLLYISLEVFGMDTEIASILIGFIVAILIVVVDDKKIHTVEKITECNRRIAKRIFEKLGLNS